MTRTTDLDFDFDPATCRYCHLPLDPMRDGDYDPETGEESMRGYHWSCTFTDPNGRFMVLMVEGPAWGDHVRRYATIERAAEEVHHLGQSNCHLGMDQRSRARWFVYDLEAATNVLEGRILCRHNGPGCFLWHRENVS